MTSTFRIGDGPAVNRLGFGTMQLTGPGVWGPPADSAIAVLRHVAELGTNLFDTVDSYGPEVAEDMLRRALHPYSGLTIATRAGLLRTGPGDLVVWHARSAKGSVLLDGFACRTLNDTRVVDVHKRPHCIVQVNDDYSLEYNAAGGRLPTRRARRDGRAGTHRAAAPTLRRGRPGGPDPGCAATLHRGQRIPPLAGRLLVDRPVDARQRPVPAPPAGADRRRPEPAWNPWLFAADTLLPIVNLGRDGYRRLTGASQWIAGALVATGWILATTAAAGAGQTLERV